MEPMKPMAPMEPMKPLEPVEQWWPKDLGRPAVAGSQNDARYAFFPDAKRLLIDEGGRQIAYHTGEHQITGAGQSGKANGLTFSTRDGPLDLDALTKA